MWSDAPLPPFDPHLGYPRGHLGTIDAFSIAVPSISMRSSIVKTLALSSSSKLPMLSMVALDAALQETIFFMSLS